MGSPYPNNPYQFSRNGQLFIIPVGPTIPEVPYPTQTFTRPPDYSQWVSGKIEEPVFQLDQARMPPSMYQEVRDDLVRYSPVSVSRSAFQRSQHAYVGVIDSKGTPYYFALDSRGISVRVADPNDSRVWKTFDRLADLEHAQALRARRADASNEVAEVDRELRYSGDRREPDEPMLVVTKGLRYGKKPDWHYDAPGSSWWRHAPHEKQPKPSAEERAAQRTKVHLEDYEARARGRQAIRDKLRAERKKTKPAKPKADDAALNAWRAKHPEGKVDTMHTHPFARALDGKLHLVVLKADKGPVTFPEDHEAAMRVPKGGSCCANCKFVDVDGHACKSEHYVKWAGTHKLPKLPLDEICSDWYEPDKPLLSKAEAHTGTMIALYLPKHVAERFALPDGEKPESMHVTLGYLGKNLTDEQKHAAVRATRRFAESVGSITASLAGVGRFSASVTSDGKDVVYLSVDSPDITAKRSRLLDELAVEGLEVSKIHGYVPHVTLKYVPVGDATPVRRVVPLTVDFENVSVVMGDQPMHFPIDRRVLVEKARKRKRHVERTGPDAWRFSKALPKNAKDDSAKKAPDRKAAKKQAGAGGKTRYTYPQEKKVKKKPKKQPGSSPQRAQHAEPVEHDDAVHSDPVELANQLKVSLHTLQTVAQKKGRKGFTRFMRSHLKRFSAKHGLGSDYWATIYSKLVAAAPPRS